MLNPYLSKQELEFFDNSYNEAVELLTQLCKIPAPSHKEDKRVEFCKNWLEQQGAENVYVDEAKNVILPINCQNAKNIVVLMAHTDTVFPDETEMPVKIENGILYSPGAGDDTANLVCLLLCAKYVLQNKLTPKDDIGFLFVCNSCEEGLGNLKGSKQIVKDFGDRISAFCSFDGYYGMVCDGAVGSTRYQVEILTEGGHSYGNFGNRNAIAVMSSMINTLYTMKVPEEGVTTYNVGVISGGTSVNTIAQQASMLYEYRSDSKNSLEKMQKFFEGVVEAYRNMGVTVNVQVVGERPCASELDAAAQKSLTDKAIEIQSYYTGGKQIPTGASSTDCNSSLSCGIPSVCFGTCLGKGAHTREEYAILNSLRTGLRIAASWTLSYFNR